MATVIWDGSAGDGSFTTAANWSTGSNPIAADDVVFNSGAVNVSTGLTPSLVTYASFTVTDDYTGLIGLEGEFLVINSTLVNIGGGSGAGSQRLNINLGTVVSTVSITSSNGTGTDTNRAPIRIICNNVGTDFFISGSSSKLGLFDEPSDTGAIGDLNVLGGNVFVGENITTYTAVNVSGSSTVVKISQPTAAQTITVDGGTVTVNGTNAIAAVVQRGGTYISNSTGIITAYTLRGGTLDMQQNEQARTITTLTQSPLNTVFKNLRGIITLTNDITFDTNYKFFTVQMTET